MKKLSTVCRTAIVLAALVACFRSAPADAAELEVSAGEPAAVVWTVPASAACGEPFTAKLEVRDRYGNVVTDADRRGIGFELSVAGRGEIWPKTVLPMSFTRGVAELQMTYKVAERIELVARSTAALSSGRGRLEGRSAPFHVSAGKLSELRVIKPASARAGSPFRITVVAMDAFGNQIKDFNARIDGVVLSTDGIGRLDPSRIPAESFVDGVADVSVIYSATGDIELRAREPKAGVAGRTATKISVGAGDPARFKFAAPAVAFVDEPFDVAITAMDALGNVVLDYDALGTVVYLGSDGSVRPSPSEVPAKLFVKGVAFLKVSYSRTEQIVLSASEPGTPRAGASDAVDIQAGRPRRFEVITAGDVRAGVSFSVKIRAVDARGNASKPPDEKMTLAIIGSVGTTPLDIPQSAFKNEWAERKVSYTVAEDIQLVAQTASGIVRSEPAHVRVMPGPIEVVEAVTPPSAMAGAGIAVNLTAMDAYRNAVTDVNAAVIARVEGAESPPAMEVPPFSFSQGKAAVALSYFRAGTIRVTTELADGRGRRFVSGAVEILPAALHHFDLSLPTRAQAGVPFRLTVTARDAYGNILVDYNRSGGGVQLHSSGIGDVQPSQVTPAAFKNGVAQIDMRSYAAERISLTAGERYGSATGQSGLLTITAGPLAHFVVSVAPKVRAGEPFPVRIEAQDVYYNLIRDFDMPGRIHLSASGQGKILPDVIGSSEFTDGVAVLSAAVTAAGKTELIVSTEDKKSSGRSNPIQILPTGAASFRVEVLDAVTAGEPFRVRVAALDPYGNPVEDPQNIGRPVRLEVAGPGTRANPITPSLFVPQLFTRGVAEGYLVYPEAGRVTVQVKGGAGSGSFRDAGLPEWRPQVEGLFFKSTADRSDVFVLATGPLEYRASQPTQFGAGLTALAITLPNASALRAFDYEALDIPGIRAAKLVADAGDVARIVLKMDATYGYSIATRANMLQVTIRPGGPAQPPTLTSPAIDKSPAPGVPSLTDIQALIDRTEYRTARQAIEQFLTAHPGHPEATALRARLEKVLKIIGE